ncbi:hypothetical protein QFC22_001164 [Naganishia vaughanmartiniae]|uniref:Uncharacterized protein n=1 Tax=Naganishia vaughanmartiniae TaxID=1424756 RepID=A0ACC2XLY3_9TREE|nr:hypothetical protein QFC22_001164 [Naganishia vaughanmartiniae]
MAKQDSSEGQDIKVLMVCLGRSPMAEAVFADQASKKPHLAPRIKVDSCGTAAYHVGEEPDERTVATCRKHGVPIDSHARALSSADFHNFTHIMAMDTNNLRNILAARPKHSPAKVYIFSKFSHDPSISGASPPKSIIDPYYGGLNGFETCYRQCVDFSDGFLEMLEDGRLQELKGIEEETEKVAKEGKKKNVKAGL